MSDFQIASISEVLNEEGEDRCAEILSRFCCPINSDVQNFLTDRNKAIAFCKQHLAMTFLVLHQVGKGSSIVGYFALANKTIFVPSCNLSSSLRKRLKKFSPNNDSSENYQIASVLIAQLGKNYKDGRALITGDRLLGFAIEKICEAQSIIGGKVVHIECRDNSNLIDFYSRNDFVEYDRRLPGEDCDHTLVQMLRYL